MAFVSKDQSTFIHSITHLLLRLGFKVNHSNIDKSVVVESNALYLKARREEFFRNPELASAYTQAMFRFN